MQAFKTRSLTALYSFLPTSDKHFFNLLCYNCPKYVEFYLCASCVLAGLCLCHWCFLCMAVWKEKFPYTGARTLDILKENEVHRDLGRRLGWISMPDCKFLLVSAGSLHLLPTLFCWLLSSSCVHQIISYGVWTSYRLWFVSVELWGVL